MIYKDKVSDEEIIELKKVVFEEMGELKIRDQEKFEEEMAKIMAGVLSDKMKPALFIRNEAIRFLCQPGRARLEICTKEEAIRIIDRAIKLITERLNDKLDDTENDEEKNIVKRDPGKAVKEKLM